MNQICFNQDPPIPASRPDPDQGCKRGLRFLLAHLKADDDGNGSLFACHARSRVLETALTLHVLRQAKIEPAWQQRLRRYLLGHANDSDGISRLTAFAALGQVSSDDVVSTLRTLMIDLEHGQRRKQALLLMIMVDLKLLPLERAGVRPEDFAAQAVHRFSQLYCAALRLIYSRHTGAGAADGEKDAAFLASCQGPNGSWEQQSLITLVALMGLGTSHLAFWRGLAFLKRVERADGGIPFIDDHNVWLSALGGLALQSRHARPDVQKQVSLFLASRQHANGGWSFADDVIQTDTDCSANAVQVLLQDGAPSGAGRIDRALDYFRQLQRDDGGYPTYERQGDSEVTITANIVLVQSLALHGRRELLPALRRARSFVLDRQHSDGRFEKSWSVCEAYSIFRVMWSLDACQRVDDTLNANEARTKALHYLLDSQHLDGGWGHTAAGASDALSTAYALAALCLIRERCQVEPMRVKSALGYLLKQQDLTTGEFPSVPDGLGPRPFVYNVPLLSTIFSVLALSLVRRGLAGHGNHGG